MCKCKYLLMKKVVKIGNAKYYVESEDDLIFLVHMLARQGYTIREISYILGISREDVQKYLEDCW